MAKQTAAAGKKTKTVTPEFKIFVVILLFLLTALRLALIYFFPQTEVISDKVYLFVALYIIFYLWIQEMIDYHKLIKINEELRDAHEQLQAAEIDTISSLIKAEEAKDVYTRGHSERVTKIALAIAEEMGLGDEEKRLIGRSGLLHDIGKIGISDAVLNKKEKLSDEEWQLIKNHSENGVKILEPLKFLEIERRIILAHHERYDGKGYPQGLRGEDIRRESLILAVADAFDAMNSKRSYRDPLTPEAILAELNRCKGYQHSAAVVDAFLRALKKKPELWVR
ncbi:MAG: HD-GYP domain-containing protein [Candidatus Omnitrophota bacterium]